MTDTFGTIDNEIEITLSSPLKELRYMSQVNRQRNQLIKTSVLLQNKLRLARARVITLLQLVDKKTHQGVWLNTMIEYDKFGYYHHIMSDDMKKDNLDDFDNSLDDFAIVNINLQKSRHQDERYWLILTLQSDDDDDREEGYIIFTLSEIKDFLLHLYYDDRIF